MYIPKGIYLHFAIICIFLYNCEMLDIKFIRENKDIVTAGAKKKHIEVDIDALITLDDERLKFLKEVVIYLLKLRKVNSLWDRKLIQLV